MGRRYYPWMLGLTALFGVRVVVQLIQAVYPLPGLPPFQAWHGSTMSYPLLLVTQGIIIYLMIWLAGQVRTDALSTQSWHARACFLFGGAYFGFMAFRLVSGLTVLSDHAWFAKSLPAFFHLVLASYVLVLGHYIQRSSKAASSGDGTHD